MVEPLSISQLIDEWLQWATWQSDPINAGKDSSHLIGWSEFNWVAQEHPEHAWQAILATVADARAKPYLGTLAAGPMEDLLCYHGNKFIERVEAEAKSNPEFAWVLGGVWQSTMAENIWQRVQSVWDRRGWDGIPRE